MPLRNYGNRAFVTQVQIRRENFVDPITFSSFASQRSSLARPFLVCILL